MTSAQRLRLRVGGYAAALIAPKGRIARGVTPWSDVVPARASVKVDANKGIALMARRLNVREPVVSMYGLSDQPAVLFSVYASTITGSLVRTDASAASAVCH